MERNAETGWYKIIVGQKWQDTNSRIDQDKQIGILSNPYPLPLGHWVGDSNLISVDIFRQGDAFWEPPAPHKAGVGQKNI